MNPSLLQIYHDLVERGDMCQDVDQEKILSYLQTLHEQLIQKPFWKKILFQLKRPEPIKGVYIHGGVGRGKTFLMDLFFSHLPTDRKKRVHFHEFMKELQDRLYIVGAEKEPPIFKLAQELMNEIDVLCLDEFFVDHIADAMLLSRLFTALFEKGLVVVATSNTPIENLYLSGFQRELFIPFIGTLKSRMVEVCLKGSHDYRQKEISDSRYLTPLNDITRNTFRTCFKGIARTDPISQTLQIQGRAIKAEGATEKDVWFSFAQICEGPRSGEDYIELASQYQNFFISDVPKLSPLNYNEAKRFMTLIDILYDHHKNLWILAETSPSLLYVSGRDSSAFKRTASRLLEMQRS